MACPWITRPPIRDDGGPAGVQLDGEGMSLRNAKALGELHEGLGFSGTGVEDIDILGLEARICGRIGDLQVPEDSGDGLGGRREVALVDDGGETSHQVAPFSWRDEHASDGLLDHPGCYMGSHRAWP